MMFMDVDCEMMSDEALIEGAQLAFELYEANMMRGISDEEADLLWADFEHVAAELENRGLLNDVPALNHTIH